MSKPEWGLKRVCQSCGGHFYDMRKNPIECPKCGTIYDPEAVLKTRRPRTAQEAAKDVPVARPIDVPEADVEATEDDDSVIEDTSELGEDDDDMAEVIEDIKDENT